MTISEIRAAKNNVNRTLHYKVIEDSTLLQAKINDLIIKTPTDDLRNTYTDLNVLFLSIEKSYKDLIKLHQI